MTTKDNRFSMIRWSNTGCVFFASLAASMATWAVTTSGVVRTLNVLGAIASVCVVMGATHLHDGILRQVRRQIDPDLWGE